MGGTADLAKSGGKFPAAPSAGRLAGSAVEITLNEDSRPKTLLPPVIRYSASPHAIFSHPTPSPRPSRGGGIAILQFAQKLDGVG